MTTLSLDQSTSTRRAAVPVIMASLVVVLTLLSIAHVAYNWTWVSATMPAGSALHTSVVVLYLAAAIYLIIAAARSLGLVGEIEPRLTGGHLHSSLLIGGGAALLTALLVTTSRAQIGIEREIVIYGSVLAQFALILVNLLYLQTANVKTALADSFGALVGDSLLRFLARDAAVGILCMLASLIVVLAVSAMPSIKAFGLKFLVTSEWRPNELQVPRKDANGDPVIEDGEAVTDTVAPAFGALPVIYGTAFSSVISLAFAVPISLGAALFLVRIAPRIRMPRALQGTRVGNPSWIVNGVSFLVEFLAAIPSIAYGIWGLFVLAPYLQSSFEPSVRSIYDRLPDPSWVGFFWVVMAVLVSCTIAGYIARNSLGSLAVTAVCCLLLLTLVLTALVGPWWAMTGLAVVTGALNTMANPVMVGRSPRSNSRIIRGTMILGTSSAFVICIIGIVLSSFFSHFWGRFFEWAGFEMLVVFAVIGLPSLIVRWIEKTETAFVYLTVVTAFVAAFLCVYFEAKVSTAISAAMPSFEHETQNLFGAAPNLRWVFQEKLSVGAENFTRHLPLTGRDMLCGGMVLAIMILPIITAISRDVLRSVPRHQVEGTVALGATWWQTSWEMLRYSRSGLFGAVMLGLARAAGETMAITMVIGNNNQIRASLFAPAQTMSSLLANEFHEASTEMHRSALTEVALVLLVMSLVFNVVARYLVVGRQQRTATG